MLCRVFVEGIWRRVEAPEDWVDIIKGKEEAGLAWIAANYLHGTFVSLLQLVVCFNLRKKLLPCPCPTRHDTLMTPKKPPKASGF